MNPLVEALLVELNWIVTWRCQVGAGGIIGCPSDYTVYVRLGVRALCAYDPSERLGDGAQYVDLRVFRSTSLGVVPPDLGRMGPTVVARD